jgi:predicted SAM-dependent methyltransferase
MNVRYGDIVRGLPVSDDSVDGVYASHVLEHLSLEDFRTALGNTMRMLRPGGLFRLVVPDLQALVGFYQQRLAQGVSETNSWLMRSTGLGTERSPRGARAVAQAIFGAGAHLWMWDEFGLTTELRNAGFSEIRRCQFGDCMDRTFLEVEVADRFDGSCAMEARKNDTRSETPGSRP